MYPSDTNSLINGAPERKKKYILGPCFTAVRCAYHAAPLTVHSHEPGTEERRGVTPHVFRVEHIAALRGASVSVRCGRWLGKSQKTLPLQNNWVGMAVDGAHHLK